MDQIPTIPRDAHAEKAVIEAALAGGEAVSQIMEHCHADDFYCPAERAAFTLLGGMFQRGLSLEQETFNAELCRLIDLPASRETGDVPAASLLGLFSASFIADMSISTHIARIKEATRLRAVHRMALHALSGIREGEDSKKLISAADRAILDVYGQAQATSIKTARQVADGALSKLEEFAKLDGKLKGLPYGLSKIELFTGGAQAQQMIVIAARPGGGKSALAQQSVLAMARAGYPVGKFDLEMSAEDHMIRAFSSSSNINLRKLMAGNGLSDHDLDALTVTAEEISTLPIFFDDASTLNLAEFRAKARRMVSKHGVRVLVVDYLQLMDGGDETASRVEEVTQITRTIKQIARELNVPIIVLAQLNRKPDGGKAELHHLRESGSIEQDADVVMLLTRKAERTEAQVKAGEFPTLLDIAKNWNGPTAEVELILQGKYVRFVEAPEQEPS
jgi:replicative DNA helicase